MKRPKRPWMPFYPADYLQDTTHLTTQQHGAYFLLMLRYWATGCIPADDMQLAQITRLDLATWQQEKAVVIAFFNADLSHKRMDAERAKSFKISRSRSAAAKSKQRKVPDPPKQSPSANAEHLPTQSQSQLQSHKDDDDVPRRVLAVSGEAQAFARELAQICGHDPEKLPRRWTDDGPGKRVQIYLNRGYRIEVMRESAKAVMRKKQENAGDPPQVVRYFDRIFAKAHAPQLPLPTVRIVSTNAEVTHAASIAGNSRNDWSTRADRRSEAHAALKASIAADDARRMGEESCEQVVRFDRGAGAR